MKKNALNSKFIIMMLIIIFAPLCVVQYSAGNEFDALMKSSKIIESDLVLQDFRNGDEKTRVIVTLFAPVVFQDRNSFNNPAFREELQNTVEATADRVIASLDPGNVRVTNRFVYIFGFSAEVTLAGLKELEESNEVDTICHDMILKPHLTQGIPLMNAQTVRSAYNGSGISIVICDTGIDTSHPMLGGGGSPVFNSKVIGGYDTGDDDPDPRPHSTLGEPHGTACAGISAGNLGTVGDYIGGVAHNAKLYAIKISPGSEGSASSSDMIEGWEWAITHQNDDPDNPIMIISTSFGGGRYTSTCDSAVPAMTAAAANAVAAGITLFVSSGNDGYINGVGWPACISHVNSVGAVYDANVGYHGYGSCSDLTTAPDQVTCYSNSASFLTLFAPSHDAYTADIVGSGGYTGGDYTTNFGGTSAACPYAAGAAAALQSAAKDITGSYLAPAEVQSLLTRTGDLITDPKITSITKPRINLQAAVNELGGCVEDDSGVLDIVGKQAAPGGTVSIPVRIQNAPNDVDSLGFEVNFPDWILTYTGFTKGALTTGFDFFDVNLVSSGLLRIGGFETGSDKIGAGTSGDVVYLNFDVDSQCDEVTDLSLQELKDDLAAWSTSTGCFDCTTCSCDVNGDSQVTPGDALLAFQKYLGLTSEDICCDVNKDDDCTPEDAQEIFKGYLGQPSVCSS